MRHFAIGATLCPMSDDTITTASKWARLNLAATLAQREVQRLRSAIGATTATDDTRALYALACELEEASSFLAQRIRAHAIQSHV